MHTRREYTITNFGITVVDVRSDKVRITRYNPTLNSVGRVLFVLAKEGYKVEDWQSHKMDDGRYAEYGVWFKQY